MARRFLRWFGRRETPEERAQELAHMSPEERRFAQESVDDRQAEGFAEEHFDNLGPERPPADELPD
jgi:hypothetical protein